MLRAAPAASGGSPLGRLPAQSLFILGAISQYLGSAFAVLLFASVPAAGVAWLRVVAAAAVLLAWRRAPTSGTAPSATTSAAA
jgi:inner membrane transporter RhtA